MLRLALATLLLAACARDKGAVVVRWRLIDAVTGTPPPGCTIDTASSCCARVHSDRLDGVGPGTGHDVGIDTIRLHVQRTADIAMPGAIEVPCATCCFACTPTEHTTDFELPEGDYKLWLEALRCGRPVGDLPPAVVRQVTAGEITNLNAIEIRIDPDTQAPRACDPASGTAPGPTCTAIDSSVDSDGGADR